ncbi:MutS protein msh4 [Leucoagaricus gongylophorus]
MEAVQAAGTLVPNDVYCDDASSFQVIQGPNMSGKSTYLRQVGLLTVMTMCGCFFPAEYPTVINLHLSVHVGTFVFARKVQLKRNCGKLVERPLNLD